MSNLLKSGVSFYKIEIRWLLIFYREQTFVVLISISARGVLSDPIFRKTTVLINVRPMRSHHCSGLDSLIKNYVMCVPDPYNYHADACDHLGTAGPRKINLLRIGYDKEILI